jgi:hypothetical protein
LGEILEVKVPKSLQISVGYDVLLQLAKNIFFFKALNQVIANSFEFR